MVMRGTPGRAGIASLFHARPEVDCPGLGDKGDLPQTVICLCSWLVHTCCVHSFLWLEEGGAILSGDRLESVVGK